MNGTLFDLGPEPAERDSSPACDHPAEKQFEQPNLFTGNIDIVCADCGATIAADYKTLGG